MFGQSIPTQLSQTRPNIKNQKLPQEKLRWAAMYNYNQSSLIFFY